MSVCAGLLAAAVPVIPPSVTWQWQIDGRIDTRVAAQVYDVDGWEASAAQVDRLHGQRRTVICYLSVGTWERWRPDASEAPAKAIGSRLAQWPGERYWDIRSPAVRRILLARLDMCQQKGFDAVEPDNMDSYSARTGLGLTRRDAVGFAEWLAEQAHARGMSIGQKNAPELTGRLVDRFDWALTEGCYADGWCRQMQPYPERGKAVLMAEYRPGSFRRACRWAGRHGFSPILKRRPLGAWRGVCEDPAGRGIL